jgi:transcriptional regulator with XRE-family HTH domain
MAVSEFGVRLRDLRKKADMNQREVAEKVKIDFTYLSKIESGVMSPPSEEVIKNLAKVLKADADELIALAGKFPSDLSQRLSDKDTLRYLRSSDFRNNIREFKRKGEE